jgi:hypothetical protein
MGRLRSHWSLDGKRLCQAPQGAWHRTLHFAWEDKKGRAILAMQLQTQKKEEFPGFM